MATLSAEAAGAAEEGFTLAATGAEGEGAALELVTAFADGEVEPAAVAAAETDVSADTTTGAIAKPTAKRIARPLGRQFFKVGISWASRGNRGNLTTRHAGCKVTGCDLMSHRRKGPIN